MPSLSLADLLTVVLFVAVLLLPGAAIGIAAGLRRWTVLAVAPLLAYGTCALAGPLSSRLGLRWNLLVLVGAAAVLAALCLAVRWATRRWAVPAEADPRVLARSGEIAVLAGVLLGGALGAVALLAGMDRLDAVHQDWDAIFHANAIRFIGDTGDASPSALREINNYEDASFFYPNAYHSLAATVAQVSGAPIAAAINAQMLLLPGAAALGLAALLRAGGARVALAATTPVLLVAFGYFPYDLLWRGPLLPYATAVALLPAFLLLLQETLDTRRAPAAVVCAVAAVGLLGLHPSVALTAALFVLPMLVYRWVGRPARIRFELPTLVVVGALSAVAGVQYALGALAVGGTGAEIDWQAVGNFGQEVGDLLLLNHGRPTPQFWLLGLLLVGAVALRGLRSFWWLLAGTAAMGLLFVAAAAYDAEWAETVTAPWWNDRWRMAGVVALGLAVVAAHGAVTLAEAAVGFGQRWARVRRLSARAALAGGLVAVLGAFGVLSNGFYLGANADRIHKAYEEVSTLTPAEMAGMRVLADLVGPGERVMNDPGDGSAWMYAYADVRPVFGHVIAPSTFDDVGPDQQTLLGRFRCLDHDQAVRDLVDRYDISYVFVGVGFVRRNFETVPGLVNLVPVRSLVPVYAQDGVRIYRVDPVDVTPPPSGAPPCGTDFDAGR